MMNMEILMLQVLVLGFDWSLVIVLRKLEMNIFQTIFLK